MLANDWTALLARELMAELRQGERQRVAWAQRRGGRTPRAWRPRLPWRGWKPLRQGGEQT
jgi:hypothetical protein